MRVSISQIEFNTTESGTDGMIGAHMTALYICWPLSHWPSNCHAKNCKSQCERLTENPNARREKTENKPRCIFALYGFIFCIKQHLEIRIHERFI